MNPVRPIRQSLGKWGSRLEDRQLSSALATAGVLEAHLDLANNPEMKAALRSLMRTSEEPVGWRRPDECLPHMTAGIAAKTAAGFNVRLEVEPEVGMQAEAFNWLRTLDKTELVDAFVRADPAHGDLTWRWPLRVGFLNDRPSKALRRALVGHLWWPQLQNLVDVTEGCDILLLPWTASQADSEPTPEVGHVGLAVVIGPIDVRPGEVARVADRLALSLNAWGCHLANNPEDVVLWFNNLMLSLSHNDPLDRALGNAGRSGRKRPDYTTLSRELVRESRLETTIGRYADRLGRLGGHLVEVPAGIGNYLPGPAPQGSTPAGAVGQFLEDAIRAGTFGYRGETHEATGFALLVEGIGPLPDPGTLATANGGEGAEPGTEGGEQVRIINGAVKDGDEPHRLALEAGKNYRLEVWIGVESQESITQPGAAAFPAGELPEGPQKISVVLTCSGNAEEVQRSQLTLPERGDSDRTSFELRFAKAGVVFGRLALAHGGRVLQTAVLRADVVDQRPSRLGRPELEVEEIIRAGFATVAEEDKFDLAVVVNRDPTGKRTASAIREDGVTFRSVDGLKIGIDTLKDALTAIADDPDAFASITSDKSLDLLFGLANLGESLHKTFVRDFGIKPGFFTRGRVQVISAVADSYLPAELFYALRPPTIKKLCRSWKKSVLAGTCMSCEALGPTDPIPICLTGFWGVRYVVERHVHNDRYKNLRGDYRLQNEPVGGANQIRPLESILWGLSNNVLAKDRTSLQRAFGKKHFTATKAKTWSDLQQKVGVLDPSMVFLLPHSDKLGILSATEIGGELEQVNLVETRMCAIREKKFVAVLLGCDTASTEVPFQGLVPRFRWSGAAVVITTINTILGRHAVPVAKELLRILKNGSAADRPMGDVMRDFRRQALSDGYPMVLSVVAFGDADWRITA